MDGSMKFTPLSSVLTLALIAGGPHCAANADDKTDRFVERKAEGWFWYEKTPEEPAPEEEKKPEPPVATPPPEQPQQTVENNFEDSIAPLSSAWLRENLQKYLDAAIDNPTMENVRAYLYLQRLSMDRAQAFSEATEMVTMGDPFLDQITRRPTASFASHQLDRNAGAARNKIAAELSKDVGLIFFFNPNDNGMSDSMAEVVKMAETSLGYTVIAVSSTGEPLKSNAFPKFKQNQGQSDVMGVVNYPAVFLMNRDGTHAPVGQGMMAYPELINRMLVSAKRQGWITEESFNETRPVLNLDQNFAAVLGNAESTLELKEIQEASKSSSEATPIPPERLVDYIRNRIKETQN